MGAFLELMNCVLPPWGSFFFLFLFWLSYSNNCPVSIFILGIKKRKKSYLWWLYWFLYEFVPSNFSLKLWLGDSFILFVFSSYIVFSCALGLGSRTCKVHTCPKVRSMVWRGFDSFIRFLAGWLCMMYHWTEIMLQQKLI